MILTLISALKYQKIFCRKKLKTSQILFITCLSSDLAELNCYRVDRALDQLLTCLGSKSIEDLKFLSSQLVDLTAGQNSDDRDPTTGPLVTMLNGALIDQCFGLNSSYEGMLRNIYKAEAKAVDFASKVILYL